MSLSFACMLSPSALASCLWFSHRSLNIGYTLALDRTHYLYSLYSYFLVGALILSRNTEVIFDSSLSYISVLQSFIRWYQLYLQMFLERTPFLFHCIPTSTNQVEALIISSYTISVASCFLLLQLCSNSLINPSYNQSDVLTVYTLAHHSSPQDIYKLSVDCGVKFKFVSTTWSVAWSYPALCDPHGL